MKVGILGGGQLARMLAMEAPRLEIEPVVHDPKPDCPAAPVARTICAGWGDPEAFEVLAGCDVVTYEFENVPDVLVSRLAERTCVRPGTRALRETSDRLWEKCLLRHLEFPTASFRAVDSRPSLERAVAELGLPAVLKTRRFGYDGKGQEMLRSPEDVDRAWKALGGRPLILEQWVDFDREASLIAVRAADGEIRMWDPTENAHVEGILRVSRAPARLEEEVGLTRAREQVARLLEHLDYVGVAAVEFFVRDGHWIANEVACRVHNSGHWTLDGAETSQFENHLRAVAGLPLGSTGTVEPSAMLNLIGELPGSAELLRFPGVRVHRYGKSPAPGRKLGHINLTASTPVEAEKLLGAVARELPDPGISEALERLAG